MVAASGLKNVTTDVQVDVSNGVNCQQAFEIPGSSPW